MNNFSKTLPMMLNHTQVEWVIDPETILEDMNKFEIVKQPYGNWFKMIRWFILRFLGWKDVMRLTSVEKRVHDIVFSQGAYKKMNFEHLIKQHFKAQKISEVIVKSQLALGPMILVRTIFSSIHLHHAHINRLQESINVEFLKAMKK